MAVHTNRKDKSESSKMYKPNDIECRSGGAFIARPLDLFSTSLGAISVEHRPSTHDVTTIKCHKISTKHTLSSIHSLI